MLISWASLGAASEAAVDSAVVLSAVLAVSLEAAALLAAVPQPASRWRRQHREKLPSSCFCPPKIAVRFILADRCVRDTVPHHLLFACLYDNKLFTENKQLFWLVTAGKRTILAMLAVTNLTSPSKLTNIVNGVCAYCLVHPCAAARIPQQTQLSLPCKIRRNTPETAKYAVSLQKTCVFANIIASESARCKISALFAEK